MIKRNQASLNRLNAFIDFLLVTFSYLFSTWLRIYALNGMRDNMVLTGRMMVAACVYAIGLLVVLALMGFYSTTRTRKMTWKLTVLFLGTTVSVLLATTLLFLFHLEDFSRGVLIIFYLVTLGLLGGKYVVTRLLLDQLRAQGYNIKHEVVIGTGKLAEQYKRNVEAEPELGLSIETILSPTDVEAIEAALARDDIDEAVIALEADEYRHIEKLISLCEKNGVRYMVIPFYNNLMPANPVIESVGDSNLINMRANKLEDIGWAGLKRGFDVIVSGVGLVILSPLLLGIAVGVKLSSPGPILFKQVRVGYNRKNFKMLKFRSMRVNDTQDTAWSTAHDDRRTTFGSFIRKTSLDELPQLWNVFRGDMSLVGPRPELPHFVEQFKETIPLYMVKHQVKPGITGWAQVNGYRGDTSIAKRIELDLWYIDNWSPGLDLKILFMTVPGSMINDEQGGAEHSPALDVKVGIASHKPYWMPNNELYLPVHVGAAGGRSALSSSSATDVHTASAAGVRSDGERTYGMEGFTRDDTGDNISARNANYCELTGLYWLWKNTNYDYLGLAHYRRHFTIKRGSSDRRDVLTLDQARMLLTKHDVLLPTSRNYWIETNYSQYCHAHHAIDLDMGCRANNV